ncbi:hypothetical protein H8F21_13800 [Pseudomonas sp. P66]|uniref:Uncharacterized protein n=1 Tax=Pseudomonas arcuscaelestis TaxID=2710591 RepID=A0ABS2BYF0_9PSED|nr:hypothetical protein [Pseudomonas arcuscaelestis]MBM5458639.1 hypothetical protein [Pseudomonas arcuscaelestis]
MAATRKMTKAQKFVADMIKHRGLEFVQLKMQVEVDGDMGTIVGMNDSCNLNVRFTNQLKLGSHVHNCHPTWRVKYFDAEGTCIAHFDGDKCVFRPGQPAAGGASHAA